jgi:Fe-S cluster biosynthesis and repair protein YggX
MNQRIAQWEKMAAEAPDDMAYFSLGNAYRDAERFEDAAAALAKAIELNPTMSRAYQLLAQVQLKLDRKDEAAATLTEGYKHAAERGDVMPQRAMASLLQQLGKPLPEVKSAPPAPEPVVGENSLVDRRSGKLGTRMPDPPMRGPTGKFIYDHFSQETWREWIGQGTKVINELRLNFADLKHQQTYEQHMLEWLGVTQEEIDEYAKQVTGK